ncbi:hypothetical protein [Senegalia sp. (in: firmicutes)]|uniref:hypothetical protein n=1 Tax=Senegalia sp. (in: firmicutes) TaxID=1924098 RepID=UPI003F9BFF12
MKKFLIFILTLSMILATSVSVFASEPIQTIRKDEVVTNEYEAILELQKLPDNELRRSGYTESEIDSINNADTLFDEHIEFLSTLEDSNLIEAGYKDEQIQNIKEYNPSEATRNDKILLSATCITTSSISNYTGTTGRVTSKFRWQGVPVFKMKDVLITSWNNWTITGKSANVKYNHIYGSQSSFWKSPTYQLPKGGMTSYGSGYRYSAALQDNYFYASEGYSIFVLKRQSRSHLETVARVSHQQGRASIGYSVFGGLDISISGKRVLLGNGYAIKR